MRPVSTGHPIYRQSPECGGRTSCVRRDTRPTWILGSRTPSVNREDSEVVYVVSPRPGRSLGWLPKPCVPRGQRTSGGADVGAFPGRAIPRARTPLCAEGRLWVLSPGETYPGRECLLGRTIYVYWTDVIYSRLKCQLSGDVLHL